MQSFEFNTTKRIICELGALSQLQAQCKQLSIKHLLIVTDPGIVECGLLDHVLAQLGDTLESVHTFDQVQADPAESIVQSARDFAIANKVDGIIGFGGGSAMDTAKVVAVLAKQQQSLHTLYGIEQITSKRLPLILVPTTAGTGSEVTPIAIITTGATTKAGIVSSILLPDVAILDAELTVGLPSHVTAATGIDAMVHAIEAYTSKHKKNAYSDMLAKEALRLLSQNIETATFNGKDLGARQNMLLGACLAGQAFANAPVAAVHALAYPLGGHFHIPHGLSNALVLPHVLRFNQDVAYQQYAELLPYIAKDIALEQDSLALSHLFISQLESLSQQLKLPQQLHTLGIEQQHLAALAADAMLQTRLLDNNPKALSYEDALAIYQQAF